AEDVDDDVLLSAAELRGRAAPHDEQREQHDRGQDHEHCEARLDGLRVPGRVRARLDGRLVLARVGHVGQVGLGFLQREAVVFELQAQQLLLVLGLELAQLELVSLDERRLLDVDARLFLDEVAALDERGIGHQAQAHVEQTDDEWRHRSLLRDLMRTAWGRLHQVSSSRARSGSSIWWTSVLNAWNAPALRGRSQ